MLGNNSRDEPQSASLRRTDLMAREEEMRRRAHSDETRQHHHGNRRKTAQLDLRLPELRRFGGKDKIAEGGKFHATAETTTVDGGDPQAIGSGEPSKDSETRRAFFRRAWGCDQRSPLRRKNPWDLRPEKQGNHIWESRVSAPRPAPPSSQRREC